MPALEALSAANAGEAIAYLARRPYDNVFVRWMIETDGLARGSACALARDAAGSVSGVCYYGPQVIPAADSHETTDAFAARVRRAAPARMLVGVRATVERFAREARRQLPPVALVRASQPVYALDRAGLRGSRVEADVRTAEASELGDVAWHSARMIAGEVGRMPDARNPDFLARTVRILEAGWWWRLHVDGELAFQCSVGSVTAETAQIQGVWTPPEMRGRGYARRAFSAICDRLLDAHPTLCLYVNDFNARAIALYERVGFTRTGEFQTLLY